MAARLDRRVKSATRTGAELPSMPGARPSQVTGADDEYIYISHRLWKDKLTRAYLEKAMALLDEGQMTRHYGRLSSTTTAPIIADERPTTAATVLKDLGYLE